MEHAPPVSADSPFKRRIEAELKLARLEQCEEMALELDAGLQTDPAWQSIETKMGLDRLASQYEKFVGVPFLQREAYRERLEAILAGLPNGELR